MEGSTMGSLEDLLRELVDVVGRQVPARDADRLRAALKTWAGDSQPAPVAPSLTPTALAQAVPLTVPPTPPAVQ